MKAIKIFLSVSILFFAAITVAQTETANYTITFQGTWSATTHPHSNFPSSAHWSNLVGATHNDNIVFVSPGSLATIGIENVAESGINDEFEQEVTAAINAGNAHLFFNEEFAAFSPTSSATTSIIADKDFPLLSLASMIAPSPDWMIQVNSLSLLDTDGNWKPSIVLDLFPYDAGTEEGDLYAFSNPETIPRQPISSLQNIAPFSNEKVGTLTVSLIALSVEDVTNTLPIQISTDVVSKTIQIYNTQRKNIDQVEIYDSFGKLVKKYSIPTNEVHKTLEVSSLPSGLYLMKLYANSGIITKKILF